MVLGQATSFVALYLYESRRVTEGGVKRDLRALLGATEAGFIIFFAIFVGLISAKYRVTFFSTLTAKRFKQLRFKVATNDEAKIDIFGCHPSYYAEIRDEVKAWVSANYSTWIEEQPDWFTERVKASIPKDMIPEESEEGEEERRRQRTGFEQGGKKKQQQQQRQPESGRRF